LRHAEKARARFYFQTVYRRRKSGSSAYILLPLMQLKDRHVKRRFIKDSPREEGGGISDGRMNHSRQRDEFIGA
jgi:hypothetical protein